jgi:hypothetical protein
MPYTFWILIQRKVSKEILHVSPTKPLVQSILNNKDVETNEFTIRFAYSKVWGEEGLTPPTENFEKCSRSNI